MIKLTMQLVCDRCGNAYGESCDFDDDDTNVMNVFDSKRRDARNDEWEVVRTKGRLEDWCGACMNKRWSEMRGDAKTEEDARDERLVS